MKVGIQLYSVKYALGKDPMGTLKKVADIGYKYWETAMVRTMADDPSGLGLPVKEAKKFLSDNGVQIVGAHLGVDIDFDKLKAAYDYHKEIGNTKVGTTGHFFPDRDEVMRMCEIYNKAGEMGQEMGMQFYYHSHWHEFQKFDGEYVMDIILNNTDPKLVAFELDNYWAARGGVDPVEMIDRYKDRIIMLHQKDFSKTAGEPLNLFAGKVDPNGNLTGQVHQDARSVEHFAEVGNGVLPIQDYIDAGNKIGVPYILLEQDMTAIDELESIQISMDAFHKFRGIEWA